MKKLLFYTSFIISVAANAQNIEENPVNFGNSPAQKSKIQKCVEYQSVNDSAGKESKIPHRIYLYNNNGNIVSDVTYSSSISADSSYILYTYNGLNLETKKYSGGVNMESDMIDASAEYFEYNGDNKL